jgi:hypothetical protein
MSIRAVKEQLPRNVCLAILAGLIVTFLGAFATRYTRSALILLPYGVDAPLGPLANVIRNAFWLFLAFCLVSLLRRKNSTNASALPIMILVLQVFVGEVVMILLDGIWQSIQRGRWTNNLEPESAFVVVTLTVLGQLVAYRARRAITSTRESRLKT